MVNHIHIYKEHFCETIKTAASHLKLKTVEKEIKLNQQNKRKTMKKEKNNEK